MLPRENFLSAFLIAVVLCGIASEASAQLISNQPFEFSRRGGGAVGMSLGYRQAIIEEKLFNRRPENLLRGATGALLEVERGPSNQAFARQQASPFLPGAGAGPARSSQHFLVFDSGAGNAGTGFAVAGIGFGGGIFLEYGLPQWSGSVSSYAPPAASPIDGWIAQLYSGHNSDTS